MPQEFHVLKCFSCSTFQVHIVKKSSNKWSCKLCNEKQSLKQTFGRGSGKDCRLQVQKLNTLRLSGQEQATFDQSSCPETEEARLSVQQSDPSLSKWNSFLPPEEPTSSEDEEDPLQVALRAANLPKRRRASKRPLERGSPPSEPRKRASLNETDPGFEAPPFQTPAEQVKMPVAQSKAPKTVSPPLSKWGQFVAPCPADENQTDQCVQIEDKSLQEKPSMFCENLFADSTNTIQKSSGSKWNQFVNSAPKAQKIGKSGSLGFVLDDSVNDDEIDDLLAM